MGAGEGTRGQAVPRAPPRARLRRPADVAAVVTVRLTRAATQALGPAPSGDLDRRWPSEPGRTWVPPATPQFRRGPTPHARLQREEAKAGGRRGAYLGAGPVSSNATQERQRHEGPRGTLGPRSGGHDGDAGTPGRRTSGPYTPPSRGPVTGRRGRDLCLPNPPTGPLPNPPTLLGS